MPKVVNVTIWTAMVIAAIADCYAAILANTFYLGINPETEPIQFGLRVLIAISLAMMSWLAVVLFFHSIQAPITLIKVVRAIMFLGLMVYTLVYNIQNSLVTNARDYHPIAGVSVPLSIPTPLGMIYIHDVYLLMLVGFAPSILPFFALLQPTKKEPTPEEMQAQYQREKTLTAIALDRAQTMAPMQEQLAQYKANGGRGLVRGMARGFGLNKLAKRLEDHEVSTESEEVIQEPSEDEERVLAAAMQPGDIKPSDLWKRLGKVMRDEKPRSVHTVTNWLTEGEPTTRQFLHARKVPPGKAGQWLIVESDILALQGSKNPKAQLIGRKYAEWQRRYGGLTLVA